MVFSPDSKPLFKASGEGNEEIIAAILDQGLQKCLDQLEQQEGTTADWINHLSAHQLPYLLEKNKHLTTQQQ